jgi:hypothetical protein
VNETFYYQGECRTISIFRLQEDMHEIEEKAARKLLDYKYVFGKKNFTE